MHQGLTQWSHSSLVWIPPPRTHFHACTGLPHPARAKHKGDPTKNDWDAARMLHPGGFGDPCLPILHGKGHSEPSLGINTRDMGVFEGEWQASPRAGRGDDWRFQRRRSVLWLLPAAPGAAGDKPLVASLGDERLRRQKGPSEHQHHDTKAAVQSPQFPSQGDGLAGYDTNLLSDIFLFFFWNCSQRGLCLNPFGWIDGGITSYLGGNKKYEKKKRLLMRSLALTTYLLSWQRARLIQGVISWTSEFHQMERLTV